MTQDSDSPDRSDDVLKQLLQYRSDLLGFIISIIRDFDTAEEILQDVCVVVLKKAEDFEVGTNFGAWVRQIARFKIQEKWRDEKKQKLLLSPQAIDAIEVAESQNPVSSQDRLKALLNCRKKLPEKSRNILSLRYDRKLKCEEVAKKVGATKTSIHMSLSRIRASLAKCINNTLSSEGI
ncbi:MAG: sigma-70 family RNA polymerase sigma factor [Lentisphaeraceae bacterium]|nr:sigma-70 family RNA polymerase sigma factor [Lentisphaeraceae bacterium]